MLDVEHELVDAHDRIRLLVAERDTARLQADQKIRLREEFRELLRTDDIEQGVAVVRKMGERIKRLEDAGDEMHRWCSNPRIVGGDTEAADEWHKAKEAKP